MEGRFDQPGTQPGILDGQRWSCLVDALLSALLEHAPIQIGAQHATSGTGDCVSLAILFTNTTLDAACGHGPLEPQKAADLGGHTRPERVDGHDHPPMDGHVVASWSTIKQVEAADPERLKLSRHREPHLHQDGDDLLAIAAFRLAA